MSIFTPQESNAFDKIVSLSSKDKNSVRDVMFAILTYATLESFNEEDNEIIIPYLCSLKINYDEVPNEKGIESSVTITAKPSAMLLKEFVAIKNGEEPAVKKYFKRQNRLNFKNFLNIEEE